MKVQLLNEAIKEIGAQAVADKVGTCKQVVWRNARSGAYLIGDEIFTRMKLRPKKVAK